MKANKELKLILIVLLIVLVSVVSFMGVNIEEKGIMKNAIAKYKLGMDLEGYRSVILKVDNSMKDVETQEDSEKTEETTTETDDVSKEQEPVNAPEVLTSENYEVSKKIIIERLKELGISNYIVKQDTVETGMISIQLPEDSKTDKAIEIMQQAGKFEIVDTETGELLINNDGIKDINVGYGQTDSGMSVYLTIQFNKEGTAKLLDITRNYVKVEETENNEATENTAIENGETTAENTATENTETTTENTETSENDTNTEANTDTEEKETEKTITMKIDGETIMTTSFSSEIQNGILQLTVGTAAKSTADLQTSLENASTMGALLKSGNMPVKYAVEENKYVLSDITQNELNFIIALAISVVTAMFVFMIIEYKESGLAMAISMIGYVAILLLLIRYTNVVLTIEGLSAIAVSIILNFILQINILKNKEITNKVINTEVLKGLEKYIPLLIIAVVFAFSGWTPIVSFGMVMFWGILEIIVYNILVTKALNNNNE